MFFSCLIPSLYYHHHRGRLVGKPFYAIGHKNHNLISTQLRRAMKRLQRHFARHETVFFSFYAGEDYLCKIPWIENQFPPHARGSPHRTPHFLVSSPGTRPSARKLSRSKSGKTIFRSTPGPGSGWAKNFSQSKPEIRAAATAACFPTPGPRNYQGKVDKKRDAGRVEVCGWNVINFHSISDSKSNFRSRLEGEGSV